MQADLHAEGRQPVVPELDVKANMPYSRPSAADKVCVPVIKLGYNHDEALPPRHTEGEQVWVRPSSRVYGECRRTFIPHL